MEVRFFKQELINKRYEESIKKAIDELILGRSNIVNGKFSIQFEELFCNYVGAKYCSFLSNGLDALSIALRAIGIKEDDEVIVPTHTFIATWLAALNLGAKVIAAPVKESNLLIDEERLESYITKKTKCIIPVHLYGNIANMQKINNIAHKHNLFVIDDVAQAHGSEINGQRVGNLADITCFSFYPTKNLGALGESGGITTNNLSLINKIKSLRNYGRSSNDYSKNIFQGGNFKGDEIQAAFLIAKLSKLQEIKENRRNLISIYENCSNKNWKLIDYCSGASPNLAVIKLKNFKLRSKLINFLAKKSIQTSIHYKIPCHKQTFLEQNQFSINDEDAMQALDISNRILSLPISEVHTFEEIKYVIDAIDEFYCKYKIV